MESIRPFAVLGNTSSSSPSKVSRDVPARLLKKRESDRLCQRIKREKTKSKIAALEEKVRNIGTQDPTGQVHSLMKQLHDVECERDSLATKVKTIEVLLRGGETEGFSAARTMTARDVPPPSYASSSMAESVGQEASNVKISLFNGDETTDSFDADLVDQSTSIPLVEDLTAQCDERLPGEALPMVVPIGDPYPIQKQPSPKSNIYPVHPLPGQPCECCAVQSTPNTRHNFNFWRYVNEVLSSRFRWPPYVRMLEDNYGDDIPVRVVVEGWDAIEARSPLHPTWQILKKIDQAILSRKDQKERFTLIYAMQRLLMAHTKPDLVSGLPEFYRQRPAQNTADSYVANFFPWPGVRERFVFNQHRYCSNEFWNTCLRSGVILWPYEFRDCYTRNLETGLYCISLQFKEHINNLKHWAMKPEIFDKWPELRADIPAADSIPPSVSNIAQRPRPFKATPQAVTRARREGPSKINTRAVQRKQHAQAYTPPNGIPPMSYYSRLPAYSTNGTTMPIIDWAEESPGLSSNNSIYFATTAYRTSMT